MLIGETLRVAFSSIRANKLRSFLTTLGIIIGIGAVITMVALGEGVQRSIEAQIQSLGSNVLTIRPGQAFFGGLDRGANRLSTDDAYALVGSSPLIRNVSGEMSRRQQIEIGRNNANVEIMGVMRPYFDIQTLELSMGRLFTDGEEAGRRRMAVVGGGVGELLDLAATELLIGQQIRIRGVPFEVVGVLKAKGEQAYGNPDERIFVPLATAQYRVIGQDRINSILVQTVSEAAMDPAISDIDRVLRREHRIRPGDASDFNVRNQTSLLTVQGEASRTFTMLLAGIAFISLVVGGIGIMNIMLVSVTERTREIGIRKALGAKRRDILLQFLIEALVLCSAGGALGVGVGAAGAEIITRTADFAAAISPMAVGVAIGFSAAVGLFFGIWPARRAARMDPIIALRYE